MKKKYWDVITGKYADFYGRAGVNEFWMFVLYGCIISIAAGIVISIFGHGFFAGLLKALYSLFCLAVLIPGLAIGVRRLHDIGKDWVWLLIGLIPVIGWIWLIVLFCQSSEAQENEYGPVPEA
jgi:uncharacterized membrane protein YhaH (DUF805 family)